MPGGLALAANGGKLKHRIARLLGTPAQAPRVSLSAITGLALLGLVAGSVAVAQTQPRAAQAKKLVTTDLRPVRETRSLPPYPKESIRLHEEGTVTLSVTVGANGAVSKAAVFKPSGHQRLDAAASQYVKEHWRWYPATRAGKPVPQTTRVSVHFKLKPKSEQPAKL